MISFIIIGKNEGWKLTKCFESVLLFVDKNAITKYEIIYVDSKSTDDSIERAKKFRKIKIFQITGICNAAIARNIGAKESKGNILFFIDGDMEIDASFFKVAFNNNNNLVYPFLSGGLVNYNYDSNWNLLFESVYGRNVKEDKHEHTTGGIFIVEKQLFNKIGGIRTKYKASEDNDFGLRLSKIGCPILRKKEIIAKHHTIPYNDNKRTWNLLFNGSELYSIVLFREHLFNLHSLRKFAFENYPLLMLIISFAFFFFFNFKYLFVIYLLFVFFKSFNYDKQINKKTLFNISKIIIRDIMRFFAFFIFFPINKKIEYKKIK